MNDRNIVTAFKTNLSYLFTAKALNKIIKKTRYQLCPGLIKNLNKDMSVHLEHKNTHTETSRLRTVQKNPPRGKKQMKKKHNLNSKVHVWRK